MQRHLSSPLLASPPKSPTPPPPKSPTPPPTPEPPPRPLTPLPEYIAQFIGQEWFEFFFPSATSKVSHAEIISQLICQQLNHPPYTHTSLTHLTHVSLHSHTSLTPHSHTTHTSLTHLTHVSPHSHLTHVSPHSHLTHVSPHSHLTHTPHSCLTSLTHLTHTPHSHSVMCFCRPSQSHGLCPSLSPPCSHASLGQQTTCTKPRLLRFAVTLIMNVGLIHLTCDTTLELICASIVRSKHWHPED